MKKIFSLLLALTTILGAWAQGGSGQGFDPTNPPDPQVGHRLTVTTAPKNGGTTTPDRARYPMADESVYCVASERLGYEFRAWMVGDSVVSTNRSFDFIMPDEDVVLTAWFDKVDFNPSNPGDPYEDGYTHRVRVYSTPSIGGYTNRNNFLLKEGEGTWLYAYNNSGFKFSCWKQDGKIISTNRSLEVKMGESNLEYTAQFVYDPSNPGEPGANSWNEATGELIMDGFNPGNLWGAIDEIIGGNTEAVSTLTVIGEIDAWDLGVVRNLPQVTHADFSRTSGFYFVPNWIFENCEVLNTLKLPACVSEIHDYAFYNCQNLSELVMYAAMPPATGWNVLYNVPDNMVVKVFSGSVDLYMAAEPWSNYRVLTIDDDSTALSVTLPDDAADGRYRNATLQLSNISTGQTQKLVITANRVKYIFGNLIPDMRYTVTVLAPNGQIMGQYVDFDMPAEGVDYKFDSLLQLQNVEVRLLTPAGENLADEASISWFDDSHNYITSGSALNGQIEGYTVSYEINIPRSLAVEYAAPANGEWTVSAEGNVIEIPLVALEKREVSGVLTDALLGEPVAGGFVTVSQTVGGQYDVSATVATAADGSYTVTVYDMPGSLTAGSADHIETTAEFESADDLTQKSSVSVRPLTGTEIMLSLLSRDNIIKGAEEGSFSTYSDFANVEFTVNNITKEAGVDFRLRYPRLLLLDGAENGDEIEVNAVPRNSGYNPSVGTTVISEEKGNVEIVFTANGDITATYGSTDAAEVIALLYDANGNLMRKAVYDDNREATFNNLSDGDYTLVTMMSSRLFSAVGSIAELRESRLSEGTDYVVNEVNVESGYITEVAVETVPVFDETMFYYTGGETSVTVNKTAVTVGGIVTVRSKVEFLPEYVNGVSNVKVIFSLPAGCEYVDNSLLGHNGSSLEEGRLTVDVDPYNASPRFCIIPQKGGEYRPSAMVEFDYNGETIRQPIGSTLLTAGDFTISVPEKTSVTRITARGTATALSEVKVYDNNVFIGTTRSLSNGDWRLTFDLFNPGDQSEHYVYAEITSDKGVKYTTTTGKCVYDSEWPELTDIDMIIGGTKADFNYIDATTKPGSYSYVPGNDMFTFKALFREGQASKVRSLDFVILLSDGSRYRISGKYLSSSDAWVCARNFPDINSLPVNVKVYYVEQRADESEQAKDIADDLNAVFRCPDIVPVIDPSGYVYEAVPSNRLEGVEATIFYREWDENMYGEAVEKVMKWDAEAYAQQNPLFTDAEGMYQWDVPQGEWQVRFEKEGYEAASTEWLPVPPPQLDVNIGMTQNVAPDVKTARAYEQSVEVEFNKYMKVSTLNGSNLAVTIESEGAEGETETVAVAGEWEPLNQEDEFATLVRFKADEPFASQTVTLLVSNQVKSYADIRMESPYSQVFTIQPEVKSVEVPEEKTVVVDETSQITVKFFPALAAAGKQLFVTGSSQLVAMPESVTVNEEGEAVVDITAELPGETVISYTLEESTFEIPSTVVTILLETGETPAPEAAAAPVASVVNGAEVEPGTSVELYTSTEGASIWYTLDGSDPVTSDSRVLYTGPIVITEETTVKAYAEKEELDHSAVITFHYTIREVDPVLEPAVAPVATIETESEVEIGAEVELYSETEGASIWYTLDGSDPVTSDSRVLYTGPIVITEETTVMAYAEAPGYLDSAVATFHYTVRIPDPAAAPVASVETESEVRRGSSIELSSETAGANVWYTLDGTDPRTSETRMLYKEPIVINQETVIKAYAEAEDYLDSDVATFHYTIKYISGVDEVDGSSLRLIALANNSGFEVKGVSDKTIVAVFDMNGANAMAPVLIYSDETVSMTALQPGVYVVKAVSGSHTASLKILKK